MRINISGALSHKWDIYLTPPLQDSVIVVENKVERLQEPLIRKKNQVETMFSELGRTACAGILTVAMAVCVSPM